MSRRLDGRWTPIRSQWWRLPEIQRLTPAAKGLLLCLQTGSLSNVSGIFLFNRLAVRIDLGLKTDVDLVPLLDELATTPSRARSLVVFDDEVLWIRYQLGQDPVYGTEKWSSKSKAGVLFELSRLPIHNVIHRQFRRHYAELFRDTPSHAPRPAPQDEASYTPPHGGRMLPILTPNPKQIQIQNPIRAPRQSAPTNSAHPAENVSDLAASFAARPSPGPPPATTDPQDVALATGQTRPEHPQVEPRAADPTPPLAESARLTPSEPGHVNGPLRRTAPPPDPTPPRPDSRAPDSRPGAPHPVADLATKALVAAQLADYHRCFPHDGRKRPQELLSRGHSDQAQ